MCADAQIALDDDKEAAKKFIWDTALSLTRGQKETGLGGRVTIAGAKKTLANVEVAIPALNLTTVTDADGRYVFPQLNEGNVDLTFTLAGYKPLSIEERFVKSGVTGRLNVELEAIVP